MTSSDEHIDTREPSVSSRVDSLSLSILTIVDVWVISFWLLDSISTPQAIATHSLAVLILALCQDRFGQARDRHRTAAMALLYLMMGPPGGPALFVALCLQSLLDPLKDTARDNSLDRRSDPEAIFDDIRQGRRHRPLSNRPPDFARIFETGEGHEHNAALAAISRKFEPEMRPALDLALKSPHAALRVQAAAVFAKLRSQFSDRATQVFLALQEAPRGREAAKLADEARLVGKSGFVDEEQRRHLLAIASVLEKRAEIECVDTLSHGMDDAPPTLDSRVKPKKIMRFSCGGIA